MFTSEEPKAKQLGSKSDMCTEWSNTQTSIWEGLFSKVVKGMLEERRLWKLAVLKSVLLRVILSEKDRRSERMNCTLFWTMLLILQYQEHRSKQCCLVSLLLQIFGCSVYARFPVRIIACLFNSGHTLKNGGKAGSWCNIHCQQYENF